MEDNRPYKIPRPKDLGEYILKNCAAYGYMVFSDKVGIATCTRCGEEFRLGKDIPHLAHETDARVTIGCPACGKPAVPKDMRYGRKKLTDHGRIAWVRAYGRVTFLEVDWFIIDYKSPHPSVLYQPVQQIRLASDKQERWDYYDGFWSVPHWEPMKTIGVKTNRGTIWGMAEEHDHLYRDRRDGIKAGTDLQYANMDPERFNEGYFDEHAMIDRMIRYMSEFLKYPAIEILEKNGFETMVMNRSSGCKSRYLNMRAKDLRKILRVDGGDVKKLRELDPTVGFHKDLHQVRKKAPWARVEDIQELANIMNHYVPTHRLRMIEDNADMSKLLRALLKEARETGDHITIGDYADYLEAVIDLGRRLDKKTLYPKNFMQAHDVALEEREKQKDEKNLGSFKAYQQAITGMSEPFGNGELFIRPAWTPSELRKESRILNHCVRSYIDRVASGETSILFIRKAAEPDKPYYTLELDPRGRIVQCRGDHNCGYQDEVQEFIDEWMAWRKKERIGA